MLQSWVIIPVALAYLGLLFAIAYYGDQRADAGPLDHRQSVHLLAVARRLRDRVDVLRQRRPRGGRRRRLPADLHRPDADDGALVARVRKIIRISKAQPHHVARRLRLVALRQERAARRAGHGHRGGRRRAVHRAAAEGGRHSYTILVHYPEVVDAGAARRRCRSWPTPRSGWRSCSRRSRSCSARATSTPPSATKGMVAAIAFESMVKLVAFLAVGAVRHLRHLRRPRRHLRAGGRARAARGAVRAAGRRGRQLRELGVAHACCRCSRSCSCRGSSRSPSSRTSTRTTSARRSGCSRCTCWR